MGVGGAFSGRARSAGRPSPRSMGAARTAAIAMSGGQGSAGRSPAVGAGTPGRPGAVRARRSRQTASRCRAAGHGPPAEGAARDVRRPRRCKRGLRVRVRVRPREGCASGARPATRNGCDQGAPADPTAYAPKYTSQLRAVQYRQAAGFARARDIVGWPVGRGMRYLQGRSDSVRQTPAPSRRSESPARPTAPPPPPPGGLDPSLRRTCTGPARAAPAACTGPARAGPRARFDARTPQIDSDCDVRWPPAQSGVWQRGSGRRRAAAAPRCGPEVEPAAGEWAERPRDRALLDSGACHFCRGPARHYTLLMGRHCSLFAWTYENTKMPANDDCELCWPT